MCSNTRGCCYLTAATVLIISAMASIILSSINLSRILAIGPSNMTMLGNMTESAKKIQFCFNDQFMTFGWISGFLALPALVTGVVAFTVKTALSQTAMWFLFLSGITAFVTSLITAATVAVVLFCHIVLGSSDYLIVLFIGILSVIQCIMSMICFFTVCAARSREASDLKDDIEPLPDPWEITASRAVLVGSPPSNNAFLSNDYGLPVLNFTPIPVAGPEYTSRTVIAESTLDPNQGKRVVLNNRGNVPQTPRQQLFPTQHMIKPFPIDRVYSLPNPYSQHELPFNCRPMS